MTKTQHFHDLEWWGHLIPKHGTVIDVGANVGEYTVPFCDRVGPEGRVYAIEPTPLLFGMLSLFMRGRPQLRLHCVGLDDRTGTRPVFHYRHWTLLPLNRSDPRYHHPNYHPGQPKELKGEFVGEFLPLDEFRRRYILPRIIDFIKIDTDGMEERILRGGEKTLREDRPILYVEVEPGPLREVGDTAGGVLDVLERCEYSYLIDTGKAPGYMERREFLASLPVDEGGANILCVPKEKKVKIA